MRKNNLNLEQIKQEATTLELQIINLYFQRISRKEISNKLSINTGKISTTVYKYGLTRFRSRNKYTINLNNLNVNNNQIWYFLGMFASDGNIYKSKHGSEIIQFTLKDKKPLEDIINILEYTGSIKEYNKPNVGLVYYLAIINKELVTFISTIFTTIYRKTNNLKFPKIDNNTQLEFFLRGYFDGDGCYTFSDKTKRFFNVECYCDSLDFINTLFNITKKHIQIVPKIQNKRFRIFSRKDVYLFLKFIYQNDLNIGLTRKYLRAKQHIQNYEKLMI